MTAGELAEILLTDPDRIVYTSDRFAECTEVVKVTPTSISDASKAGYTIGSSSFDTTDQIFII